MFNPSPTVRLVIYAITSLAAILVTYLSAVHKIGPEAVTAFGAVVAFVSGLAGYNVSK
jgi:disulfide bond formation protein DsbB